MHGEGLGDVTVHPRRPAGLDLFDQHLDGERHHCNLPAGAGKGADAARGFESVDRGHRHVHQHEVEVRRSSRGDRLLPIFGERDFVAGRADVAAGEFPVDRRIVDHQHTQAHRGGSGDRLRLVIAQQRAQARHGASTNNSMPVVWLRGVKVV